jgi:hypothetical protein
VTSDDELLLAAAPAPRPAGGTWPRGDGAYDSVQWLDLPARAAALDLAALERAYFAWVPRIAADAVGPVPGPGGALSIGPLLTGARPPAIRMAPAVEGPGGVGTRRRGRAILGGLLASAGGELAFELGPAPGAPAPVRLRVALVGFRTRLPGALYLATQARLHLRSTFAFLREVARATV